MNRCHLSKQHMFRCNQLMFSEFLEHDDQYSKYRCLFDTVVSESAWYN